MTSPALANALPFLLRWEGGYVNHPRDPGGATNKGVTQKVYSAWRQQKGLAPQDVRHLADDEMHAIYESGYWLAAKCDRLDEPLDLVQFDTAVNMGPGRAVQFLQRAVGAKVDGSFGPATQQCLANCNTGDALVGYCDTRERFYRSLVENKPDQGVFLKGWLNRLNSLRKHIGLPGYESASDEVDYGEAGFMGRVPDIGEGDALDFDSR